MSSSLSSPVPWRWGWPSCPLWPSPPCSAHSGRPRAAPSGNRWSHHPRALRGAAVAGRSSGDLLASPCEGETNRSEGWTEKIQHISKINESDMVKERARRRTKTTYRGKRHGSKVYLGLWQYRSSSVQQHLNHLLMATPGSTVERSETILGKQTVFIPLLFHEFITIGDNHTYLQNDFGNMFVYRGRNPSAKNTWWPNFKLSCPWRWWYNMDAVWVLLKNYTF